MRLCQWCQATLINKRSDAMYCSRKCKKSSWDRKKYPTPAKRLNACERKTMRLNSKLNWQKRNRKRHLQIRNTWSKKTYANNVTYKIAVNLRNRLYSALHKKEKQGSSIKELGCSLNKLKIHLQMQFRRNPRSSKEYMSWHNHTKSGWHIDHIRPLSSFNLSLPEEFKQACHYSNLQPLWWFENIKKGSSTEGASLIPNNKLY